MQVRILARTTNQLWLYVHFIFCRNKIDIITWGPRGSARHSLRESKRSINDKTIITIIISTTWVPGQPETKQSLPPTHYTRNRFTLIMIIVQQTITDTCKTPPPIFLHYEKHNEWRKITIKTNRETWAPARQPNAWHVRGTPNNNEQQTNKQLTLSVDTLTTSKSKVPQRQTSGISAAHSWPEIGQPPIILLQNRMFV